MSLTIYSDLSPAVTTYAAKEMLKRGIPFMVLEQVMDLKPLPAFNTRTMTLSRYNALTPLTSALTEGVDPPSQKITKTDVAATLELWGGWNELSELLLDTSTDPVLNEHIAILGEQAAQSIEKMRFNKFKAGTNLFRSNGSARTDINTPVTAPIQKKVIRALKRQNAMVITRKVASTPDFNTENVLPSYIAVGNVDLENDIRTMTGFQDVKEYSSNTTIYDGEIGSVPPVRYCLSTLYSPYADAGGAAGSMVSTSGTSADVYPLLYIARNSLAGIALKGAFAIQPIIVQPKAGSGNPLGLRGSIGWKTYQTAVITNDSWIAVLECAATDLT